MASVLIKIDSTEAVDSLAHARWVIVTEAAVGPPGPPGLSGDVQFVEEMTQAEYDALGPGRPDNTLYLITG